MSHADQASELPVWDLSDLYPDRESVALQHDLSRVGKDADNFAANHKDRIAEYDGEQLAVAITEYEQIEELLGRIISFASLTYAANMTDPEIGKFYADIRERLNDETSKLLFFELELNRLSDETLELKLNDCPALTHYRPWLRDLRVMRPYQLSDDLEKLLHEKQVSGRGAWNRLFDETMAGLTFDVNGDTLGLEQTLHLLSEPTASTREDAARSLSKTFGNNIRLFTQITNTLAKDKEIEDRWRGYPEPETARHLTNQVESEVVTALFEAVRDAYPRLSHRYYKIKANWLGAEQLDYWDRNAPLPEEDNRTISWTEARSTVLSAYGDFAPEMATIGQRFFDNDWIDVPTRAGKSPGAFAHPTVPSAHPYLLLNFQGKTRDVMTLAHELGHGVHQVLAAGQGALMADTPLTLAETASVFGEQLTFQKMLRGEDDPQQKKVMLANKVEDMINTVIRQIAFYDFERRLHRQRREAELTSGDIGKIWMAVQSESLGPAIRLDPEYAEFWCYIPHFIHSPFYVYAYAFGDCLVNSLYAVYQSAAGGFQEKYFDMLRAGGTLRHKDLLQPFGLDAGDPDFWQKGLGVIEGFIDQLEDVASA